MEPLQAEDPQVIGVYRLLGRLGAGGMGRVYLGRSAGGRTVAVKVVHPHFALDDQFRARFRREVAAARRVGGAWTAPVLDADPDAPVPWVATGYVAGPSLTEAVLATGPQPERTVRALGAGLAQALAAVHALGLVHRDVKPSNVLLALDGPRLIDFGIARATEGTASLTATGVSVGSPGYMAPEQILGHAVTGAADVFSLGAVLAYAATGEPPFPGDSAAVLLYKVVHEAPALGPALAGDPRSLVESCLAKDPAARPAPREIAAALAPDGADALVGAGWLPRVLVERVSRRAVELLDLETGAPTVADRAGPPPAGPVEPAAAAAPGPGQGLAQGLAPDRGPGPQDAVTTGAGVPGAADRADVSLAKDGCPPAESGPARADSGPAQAETRPARATSRPAGATSQPVQATSQPVQATSQPARRLRAKVLAATALLAAVAVTTVVLTLLPGEGGKGGKGGEGASKTETGTVPGKFLGTWTGQIVQNDGTPNGTMTAVIKDGAPGTYVVRTTYSALNVLECHSKGKLLTANPTRLTLEEATDGEPSLGCTGETARITFSPAPDGKLAYASEDTKGGKPHATLTRRGD
ncbi:serine/threonine-protein kinase [Streptomyces roseoverticillatus]|uniref:serine/threonine-protein kinase n=1 Tax=Streptomyces roseoverticillatus TaxID=66429 RepID=UPI0004BF5AAB|nr:serine/threonine-protein kinase [Streptomyces roseoverticillatus]